MKTKPIIFLCFTAQFLMAQSTITVSTPMEFIKAIGSNRTIIVNEGTYILTDVAGTVTDYVSWQDEYDGPQLVVNKVKNLRIVGKNNPRLLVLPSYSWVMLFSGSSNVEVSGITMGHLQEGYCTGGVVKLDSCANVKLTKCNMFGSGTYGMEINGSSDVTVEGCDIFKCTYGLLILYNSSRITFNKTRFRETGQFDLITINNCPDVNFKSCVFENNMKTVAYSSDAYFFSVDASYYTRDEKMITEVSINNCEFRDNWVYNFSQGLVRIGVNRFSGNSFSVPSPTANYMDDARLFILPEVYGE